MSIEELFFDYMWHIGVMDKFVINYIKTRLYYGEPVDDIQKILKQACHVGELFVWDYTNEGWLFWYTVDYFGKLLCKIMNEEHKTRKSINKTIRKHFNLVLEDEEDISNSDYQRLIKKIESYTKDRFQKIALK